MTNQKHSLQHCSKNPLNLLTVTLWLCSLLTGDFAFHNLNCIIHLGYHCLDSLLLSNLRPCFFMWDMNTNNKKPSWRKPIERCQCSSVQGTPYHQSSRTKSVTLTMQTLKEKKNIQSMTNQKHNLQHSSKNTCNLLTVMLWLCSLRTGDCSFHTWIV